MDVKFHKNAMISRTKKNWKIKGLAIYGEEWFWVI